MYQVMDCAEKPTGIESRCGQIAGIGLMFLYLG